MENALSLDSTVQLRHKTLRDATIKKYLWGNTLIYQLYIEDEK